MKNEITYTEHNGLYYPDLALPEQTNYPLGKYSNLRLDFIKKHRRGTYTTLLTEGRLNEYLHDIDIQAHNLLDDIIPRLAQERGIDEVPLLVGRGNHFIYVASSKIERRKPRAPKDSFCYDMVDRQKITIKNLYKSALTHH